MLKRQEAREGTRFGRVYYHVNALNDRGQVTGYNKGQELMTVSYDDAGHVAGISTGTDYIQADTYSFDGMGNLTSRHLTASQQQTFAYDNLNRVTTVDGQVVYSYADNGNLERKDGWDQRYNETANSPIHGITSRSKGSMTETFGYDKNGNQTWAKKNGTNWRTVTYSGRNKATEISINGKKAYFKYDANNRRYKRVDSEQTIYYVGALELTVNHTVNDQYIKRYIGNDAMQTYYAAGNASIKWLFTDHQGSITAITDDSFKLLKRFAYDVFGQQSEIAPTALEAQLYYAQQSNLSAFNAIASNTRGYTGHEQVMLDGDNRVIHMNGRIYDAGTGRMMQADPVVQAPSNLQNYNAYSYVLNNPLSRIDPSGYISLNPFKKITRDLIRSATKIFGAGLVNLVGSFVSTYFGGPWGAAAWSYEFTRAMGGSSSQAFRSAAISYVATSLPTVNTGSALGNFLVEGAVGGSLSYASGGNFGHGFWSAGLNSAVGGSTMTNNAIANVAISGAIGGTISKVTGGKFANGATSAAFSAALRQDWGNKSASHQRQGYVNNLDRADLEGVPDEVRKAIRTLIDSGNHEAAAHVAANYLGSSLSAVSGGFEVDLTVTSFGEVDVNNKLSLYKNAFESVSTLISTVGHELVHVKQYNGQAITKISFDINSDLFYMNEIEAYQWELSNSKVTGLSDRGMNFARDSMEHYRSFLKDDNNYWKARGF